MNVLIMTQSISSKTDQDTDQESWILISVDTKYSVFAASIITYNNNTARYCSFLDTVSSQILTTNSSATKRPFRQYLRSER